MKRRKAAKSARRKLEAIDASLPVPSRSIGVGASEPQAAAKPLGQGDVSTCRLIDVANRLREAGMLLLSCSRSGNPVDSPLTGKDWLTDLFYTSPMFRKSLRDATRRWASSSQAIESLPGVWLDPFPVVRRAPGGRGRRVEAYHVTIVVTDALLRSEQFSALCQSAGQDEKLSRTLLGEVALRLARIDGDSNRTESIPGEVRSLLVLSRSLLESAIDLTANAQVIESTGQQLAESYEEINLLYTIIQSMTVVQQPEKFVTIACHGLLDTLPFTWVGAKLAEDQQRLKKLAGRFIVAGTPRGSSARLGEMAGELLREAQADTPLVLEPDVRPDHAQYAEFGSTALVYPVATDGRVVGVLIAGDKRGSSNGQPSNTATTDATVSNIDIKLIGATASHMAIFLENAALYDDLNAMFLGTLEALTASIDAKDRYTCGHSQRVAHLTQLLATAVGLEEPVVGRMHIAGLVHDVGKIGVPESVLLKPGKLTDEEFDWIRKHPEIGYRILKDIPQLASTVEDGSDDVLAGVLHHHERWDGMGYPKGLAGDQIPLVARLICLADAFDAMSSTRTYRDAMGRDAVLREIFRCGGTQFDPELAPIFVRLDFSEYDRLVAEHDAGYRISGFGDQRNRRGAA